MEQRGDELAAVIIEPVAGNMGVIPPKPGFLEELRRLTEEKGIVLIFDEVMTGFRVDYHSAQGRYHVMPDLTTMGKVIGGGLPVGAYGGKKEILQLIAPEGPVYQAGTLVRQSDRDGCRKSNSVGNDPRTISVLRGERKAVGRRISSER